MIGEASASGARAFVSTINDATPLIRGVISNDLIVDNIFNDTAIPTSAPATIANAAAAARTTPIARYAPAATAGLPSICARPAIPRLNTARALTTIATNAKKLPMPPAFITIAYTTPNITNAILVVIKADTILFNITIARTAFCSSKFLLT